MDHISILTSNALTLTNQIANKANNKKKNCHLTSDFNVPEWISAKN